MPEALSRFGPFVLDRRAYRVARDGQPVDLTPRLLDLLFYLAEHPGTLVTKEALLDALWPDANVTENALAQAMSELRQALGDDAADPQYIKTVSRRGYRFIAAIETVEPTPSPPPTEAAAIGPATANTIAVLDFTNVTNDADAAWLSAGIAETVTGDLRAFGSFRVIDRWRVKEAAQRAAGSMAKTAADVGARLVLVGSYQRAGERLRITARIVDVVNGDALADAKVDGAIGDIFSLQDQITTQLARELGVARGSAPVPTVPDTPSLAAYRAFSEGWMALESLDVRDMPRAIAEFERAIAEDAKYALAHTGLASAELASYESTRSDNEPDAQLLDRALANAQRAVALDDTLAEAHATLAHALASRWETREAKDAARKAVAIEPGNWRHLFRLGLACWGEERLRAAEKTLALYPDFAFAYFQIAMVHVARGALTDAETVLRHGAAVQDRQIGRGGRYPALGLHWLLGLVRLAHDDVDEALTEFAHERALAEPHRLYGREYQMSAWYGSGAAFLRRRQPSEAIDALQHALEWYPSHGQTQVALALACAEAGRDGESRRAAAVATNTIGVLDRSRPIEAAMVRAQQQALAGDHDGTAGTLRALLENAPAGFAGWTIPIEPLLWEVVHSKAFTSVRSGLAARAA